ncbi:MAG: TonB-dependent siderophore receptor [Gammaproteobacteria bacterium]|nr:MAG: TonB-dependent siderophore receptor [Gammaproteobacteria bacterium]
MLDYRLILITLSMHAASAHAQSGTQTEQETSPVPLDEIIVVGDANRSAATTATRVPVEALATPFTISLLPEHVIEASGSRTLADALRYAGTVGGTDNFGNAGEFFSSRGFQLANGRNYFRDGLRYRKFGQVPLYDIERIEILRGPASILYGALEPGGVLNMVSRSPSDSFAARARVRAGEFDYYQGTFDLTGPVANGLTARVQGLFEDAGSFRDLVENRSTGVTGTVDWRPNASTLITGRVSWFKDRRTGDRGIVMAYQDGGRFSDAQGRAFDFAHVPRSRFLGEEFGTNEFRDINLAVSLRHELGPQWQLRADIVRADQEEERVYIWAIGVGQIVDTNGLLNRQIGDWNARLKGTLGRLEVAGELRSGPLTHNLLFGGEAERFDNDRSNERFQFAPIDIFAPSYFATRPANGPRTLDAPFGSLLKTRGVYLQNVMEIGDHFVLLAGVRYDRITDDNTLSGQRRLASSSWVPQAGLVWRPTPFVSPYISYTRSFVPQSGEDRFGVPFDPQRGKQVEGGIKLDIRAARAVVTAAVFSLDRDNLTVTDPVDPAFRRLAGLQRSRGFELSLDSAPIEGLRVNVAYNHLFSAEFVNDNSFAGNTLPNAPESALGLFVIYDIPAIEGLSLSGGLTHVDERFGIASNLFSLPAYTLVDLGARYRLSDKLEVSANIRNLFDKTYYTGSINSTTIGVGQPRSVMLGLSVSL